MHAATRDRDAMPCAYEAAGAFFAALTAAGVERICVSPGSRSTPLVVSAHREPGLSISVHLDERSAAFFALGLAKASRKPTALICTSGTAAANYLPAVVEAHYAGVPLLVITADRPPELREWGAGQTIDQHRLFGQHVRAFVECPVPMTPEQAVSIARRAVSDTLAARPGPVHLNWPMREPLEPPTDLRFDRIELEHAPIRRADLPVAREEVIAELCALALSTERGLLLCGDQDTGDDLPDALAALAIATGWPLLADATSQLRRGPHVKGAPILATGDVLLRTALADAMRPEVVVAFGGSPVSKAQRLWLERVRPGCVWIISPPGVWNDPNHLARRQLAVDATHLCREVATRVRSQLSRTEPRTEPRPWTKAWQSADAAASARLARELDRTEELYEAKVTRELERALPADALLFVSNSMPVRDLELALSCDERPLRVLCNRGANGIDGVTSAALGAADAGKGPVVLLTGDLAFLHDVGGLAASAACSGNATIIVLDNDGGGIFSHLPIAAHGESVAFEPLFRTPHGLTLARASALYGLTHHRVTDAVAFRSALADSLARPGVEVIEVPVDRDANLAHFRALIRTAGDDANRAWERNP